MCLCVCVSVKIYINCCFQLNMCWYCFCLLGSPRDDVSESEEQVAMSPRLRARQSAREAAVAAAATDAAPVWVADDESTVCLLCRATFTLVRRRHHCRKCGKLVCGKCSSRTLDLGELG